MNSYVKSPYDYVREGFFFHNYSSLQSDSIVVLLETLEWFPCLDQKIQLKHHNPYYNDFKMLFIMIL